MARNRTVEPFQSYGDGLVWVRPYTITAVKYTAVTVYGTVPTPSGRLEISLWVM